MEFIGKSGWHYIFSVRPPHIRNMELSDTDSASCAGGLILAGFVIGRNTSR
jgi:hypothetical protein